MAQKIIQTQSLQQTQTLSPQQVLQVRLLEMPVSELEQRVKNEIIENGALEESDHFSEADDSYNSDTQDDAYETGEGGMEAYSDLVSSPSKELKDALGDYRNSDEVPDYLLKNYPQNDTVETIEYSDTISFYEQMKEQMNECELTEKQKMLMEYLIGSLENDGLLKKPLSTLADELEVYHNEQTTVEELEQVLHILQDFEPAGIGARSLQECLQIQIRRDERFHTPLKQKEYRIVTQFYEEFTHKRWDKIQQRMKLTDQEVELLQKEIRKLNPRPGSSMGEIVGHNYQQVVPDFIVETDDDGTITMTLNQGDVPELKISDSFLDLLKQYDQGRQKISRSEKDALLYTKQKIEKAQIFIDAIRQRRHTLTVTMQAIIDLQRPFFLEGDELLLKPMILKDVAERTGLDISTISRVSNSKYVQTNYGIYPLKWFFSDGYTTDDGQEIATRKIQNALKEIIENEDKKKPLSDEVLTQMLNQKGFPIARRTVAKYREQLGIPVARLRK
ncbi:MAG: RNA polymerase factor sigma-54 [Candidatus Paraprevotella stercoravium]|jgi:RNA polymerase sigma-54 factor|uniref:RNA polymerase factor sigma-54 n=2 Tax=Bacteroidales TaxID=171549 RepID=A0ABT7U324_9BACE|nr:RNA polymerase factor sigma-54 [Candidatus Paraprevotella stercoravium]MDM8144668.1 RNA polymerase factor sigma-54 [Bacteroides eggerthii]